MSNILINKQSNQNEINTKFKNENNKQEKIFQSQSTSDNNSIEEENMNEYIINKNESIIIKAKEVDNKKEYIKNWEISDTCDLENFQLKIDKRVEEILIDIFENTFKNYNNKHTITNKSIRFSKDIKYYCEELHYHFAIFILNVLSTKLIPLIDYIAENYIDFSNVNVQKIFKIRNCLNQTGNDIQTIFKSAFNRTYYFDIGSILIEIFLRNILSQSEISNFIKDEDYEKLEKISSIGEKDRFESYLNQFKNDIYLYDDEYNFDYNNEEEKEEEEEEKIEEFKKEENKVNDNNINNICLKDIDELVEYINSNDIPLKKGKRKKKKNKKNKNLINNNQDNLNDSSLINIKDEIVEDFKYAINEYTSTNYRKIKPNISKDWLCKISELNI
jgi:hypothetical protein